VIARGSLHRIVSIKKGFHRITLAAQTIAQREYQAGFIFD
jgi:hypothetical protein